ncbi:MAG: aminotransferase [Acidobacteriales bacterium]|nr:aminotransferase [Terriglobales bacterium]
MNFQRSHARSSYMEFAKLYSGAKYNLATSGMASYPLADLGVTIDQLEINGSTIYGYEPLNRAIAARYRVPVESVVAATGTSMANYLTLAASANPGEEILVEQPTYGLILDAARYLGLDIKRFQRDPKTFDIDLADLERNISKRTKLIVLCNLHNPTSALTPESTLRTIGEFAKKVGARVLADEVYLEVLWQHEPKSAFHIDPEVFISTNSLTKAYGLSGLRCGWVLTTPEMADRMWHLNDVHAATPAHIPELLSVVAFSKLDQIAAKQKAVLDENRRLLRAFLESQSQLEYVWPEHGTVVFPHVKAVKGTADEFCKRLLQDSNISVVPGSFFEMPEHIRIGVGTPTESVRASLGQFTKALNSKRK